MSVTVTPNLRLNVPYYDQAPWDADVNNNWTILDSVVSTLISIPGLAGVWANATAYTIGQVVTDPANGSIWKCNVAHTSAVAPTTFAQDRTAHPSYWTVTSITAMAYLPVTGGTISGNLTVATPSGVGGGIVMSSVAGATNFLIGQRAGKNRWTMQLTNGEAESSGNKGSNFDIQSYADDGTTIIGTPLSINRSDGAVTIPGTVTTGPAHFSATGGGLPLVVDDGTTNTQVQFVCNVTAGMVMTSSSGTSNILFKRGVTNRWFIGSSGSESGSNTGSDVTFTPTNDAGATLATALKISRGTGNVQIGTTTDGGDKLRVLGKSRISAGVAGDVPLTVDDGTATVQVLTVCNVTPGMIFNSPTGTSTVLFQRATVNRWFIGTAGTETGGALGSDMAFTPCNDTGALQTTVLRLSRATGNVQIGTSTDAGYKLEVAGSTKLNGTVGFQGTNPIAKPAITGSRSGATATVLGDLLTALANYGLITNSTTA